MATEGCEIKCISLLDVAKFVALRILEKKTELTEGCIMQIPLELRVYNVAGLIKNCELTLLMEGCK